MRRSNSLASGFPGTMTTPFSPPLKASSRPSSLSPPFTFLASWHSKHALCSTGNTSCAKSGTLPATALPAASTTLRHRGVR